MERRELEKRLRAIREPAPSAELRARLEQGIPDSIRRPESSWIPGRLSMVTKVATVMVALTGIIWLLMTLLLGPGTTPAYAAMLEPVLQATNQARAVHVVLRMLTREGEDFAFVNLDGELSPVEAWIVWPAMPGDPGRSRVDKPDRIRCFDGTQTIHYHPNHNEAYRGRGGAVYTELFWPAAWVRHLQNIPTPGVEVVSQEQSAGRGRLVLREKGAPTGPRAAAFLGEFDRETEIEWDLETNLLTGLRRWVWIDGQRRLFSELVSIEYLPSIDDEVFELDLPEDVRWGGVTDAPLSMLELGPREVAFELFEAARTGDRERLEMLCGSPAVVDFLLEKRHRPDKLLFLGEPFRSGDYPGVYVPYKVRFSGGVQEHNLALRNDNPQRRWVYDGGI